MLLYRCSFPGGLGAVLAHQPGTRLPHGSVRTRLPHGQARHVSPTDRSGRSSPRTGRARLPDVRVSMRLPRDGRLSYPASYLCRGLCHRWGLWSAMVTASLPWAPGKQIMEHHTPHCPTAYLPAAHDRSTFRSHGHALWTGQGVGGKPGERGDPRESRRDPGPPGDGRWLVANAHNW